jgi:hypothetical protein
VPAARHGGRRGLCADEVGSMQRARGGWRALVGAGKGGGNVNLARRRPEPGARRGGHGGERGGRPGAMQGQERGSARCRGGQRPFMAAKN